MAKLFAALLAVLASAAGAVEVRFERVADNVYAHVGDIGARTAANEGLNANIGLVVTPAGAVLIDSGATFRSARDIHAAMRKLTVQPLRWVVNTGGQDHRGLGNGDSQAQRAEVIAHAGAVSDMRSRGGDQLAAPRTLLGPAADGTVPTLPTRLLEGADNRLELGGTVFEFRHRGGGHTPGDTMVWLPQTQVAFAGDIVYVDRLLAVLPVSSTLANRAGHGRVTDLAAARAQTRAYLESLRAHMKRAVEQGIDVSEAVKSVDAKPFLHLSNAAELNPGNASRTYLEVERE